MAAIDALLNGRLPVFNVKNPAFAGGAKGDGVVDDSAAIQAAIDAATAAGGGRVHLPEGTYRCNVVLKANVSIGGNADHISNYIGASVTLKQAAPGPIIDTPAGQTTNIGVSNVFLSGLGAGTAGKGIYFRNVYYGVIHRVGLSDFADEGIRQDAGLGGRYTNIVAIRCVLNRARAGVTGAIHLGGTDHWVSSVEASTSSSIEGTISSASLFVVAFAVVGSNDWFSDCVAEISDVGWYNSGSFNRYSGCRADLNYAHGFWFTGAGPFLCQLSNCLALNNSQATDNTYDGFHFDNVGVLNLIVNCLSNSSNANGHRYGFYDDTQTGTQKNHWVNPLDVGAKTSGYFTNNNSGSGMLFASGAFTTLTANSATPSVAGNGSFLTANTIATTVTNFAGGVNGQIINILANDANTTIQHNGATIVLGNSGNVKLRSGATYTFLNSGGTWREVLPLTLGSVADVGDAAKTLQARLDEETQTWNTPLTVARAVTLSTTGAYAGAKFKIVRTAAATGAFNLNVGTGPLKALTAGQWCEVTYNGAAWVLTGFGSL